MIKEEFDLQVENQVVKITNPQKLLWPEANLSKLDYIKYLIEMAAYLLPYLKDRLLTTIRYPDGIHGKSFYQKNMPDYAPEWIQTYSWRDTNYILANDLPTLVWLGNQACIELHVSFHYCFQERVPTELVFDLDPSDVDNFSLVLEVALNIREVLDSLGLTCQAKTSGASGLQIYIPIAPRYTFEETRMLNKFIAHYIAEKYPHQVTIERLIKNRGSKLYFDYLQHGEGKTLPAPYSPRAREEATVSAPVTWEEIQKGVRPTDFTIKTMAQRVEKKGDLFAMITTAKIDQSLDELLRFVKAVVQ